MTLTHRGPFHVDDRGSITDIVQDAEFQHATLITSKAGSLRGNHYHEHTTQAVYVLTGALTVYWCAPGGHVQQIVARPGDLAVHPPLERHAYVALEDASFLVLTSGPRGGDHYETDTIREALV